MIKELSILNIRDFLSKRLTQQLPGHIAHDVMRARPNGNIIPNFKHSLPPKPGSVLILLTERNGEIAFPLIKRQEYLGAHSGQISLPGGKAEEGESEVETALREGFEEIGVPQDKIEVVGKLSEFFVIPSNFIVRPVIGLLHQPVEFIKDNREVEKIIFGTLTNLLADQVAKEKEILAAGRFKMWAPHFEIENEIVWGATAMMLNELRMILKEKF
ncbi:MAG: CoA pyrophosphatase [Cyclobacteriaceae bacterium]|jgi:8-oxo-dGTP pyrophosphatase MutT (NUDIX family)|nr:CoA pyrophosphatase [Cyclobacteriaceae bacterium]